MAQQSYTKKTEVVKLGLNAQKRRLLEGPSLIRIVPVMLSKSEQEELNGCDLQHLYEQCLAQMAEDSDLTPEQKQELLLQLELSDQDWEPIRLAEGVEPISETIIKMRRGNNS